tara:strand:+ start:38 stop:199 length:162 start_codon:yes stop_codon:yes gene_type:complete
MSVLGKLIVDCPKYGHDEFLINTQVAIHVQESAVTNILKYFSDEAVIDFEEIC